MKARTLLLVAFIFVMLPSVDRGIAQSISNDSVGNNGVGNAGVGALPFVKLNAGSPALPRTFRPFSKIGIDSYAGVGGIGLDIAAAISRNLNLRAGSEYFGYSTTFVDQGADVAINARTQSGHASLDWFPFSGGFRLSPLIVFANNNRVRATALVAAGNTITLNGQDYISSTTDPLHGAGSVDFRKTSPGFTVGWGNNVPRSSGHFSFPIEAGFYYVGQPRLKVTFTGSACDPTEPPEVGCESVNDDAGFQQSLAAFIARNNHNLSYASFFPILSFGFGYSFYVGK
jgi:hypothetical protein